MTLVANLSIERYLGALGAADDTRVRYKAMLSPDTPELSASCFSSTDSDHTLYSPLSPVSLSPISVHKLPMDFGSALSPLHPSFHAVMPGGNQDHVGDDDHDIARLVSVPPNSPLTATARDDAFTGLRRQHKPLPFLTTFMASAMIMELFADDEAQEASRHGVCPLPPTTKSEFNAIEETVPSVLQTTFVSKDERRHRVLSLRLHSPLEPETPIIAIDTPYETPARNFSSWSPGSDSAERSSSIRLEGLSPIVRGRPTQRLLIPSPVRTRQRRWTIGGDEDDILTPLSSHPEHSPLEPPIVPSNTPASGLILRPSLPSLSDPAFSTECMSARRVLLASKALVRSERHYLDKLRAIRPKGLLESEAYQSLQRISEGLSAKLEQDCSATGVARAFISEADVMEVAFATWGNVLRGTDNVVRQRSAGYVSHFREILCGTPKSVSSWFTVSRALECAMRVAEKCAAVQECE